MTRRMLGELKIPSEVYDTFELTSVHFAHVFWNELYHSAKVKYNNEGGASITEVYKNSMIYYHKSMTLQKKAWMSNTLTHCKLKFQDYGIRLITLNDCIVHIADTFIPEKYADSISISDKYNIVYSCLSDIVGELIHEIIAKYLTMIIDNHSDVENMRCLKNAIVELFIMEREKMCNKFVETEISDTRIHTDVATAKKIRSDIEKVKKINAQLQEELGQLRQELASRDAKYKEILTSQIQSQADITRYRATISQLIQKIRKLQDQNGKLFNKFDEDLRGWQPDSNIDHVRLVDHVRTEHSPVRMDDHMIDHANMVDREFSSETREFPDYPNSPDNRVSPPPETIFEPVDTGKRGSKKSALAAFALED